MARLFGIELVPAAVPRTATFLEAAEILAAHPVATIAVLGEEEEVVGLFGDADLLSGFFPAYLAELRHTAFATDDEGLLADRTRAVAREPVEKHMRRPVALDLETSAVHAAERFLHCDFAALPVADRGAFVGMLGRAEFCRAILREWAEQTDAPRPS
ncbi:MAG TPA: CBS domain-containing protein [Gaiellaceae bacterium]|jgi:CBS domain-containing protein|nr:CBS domain-containing protein [Gaiellaceae bacterium]